MNETADLDYGLHRVASAHPGQWLYLLADEGVVYSETQNRFVGVSAAGVAAYQAFDAGATLEDLRRFSDAPTCSIAVDTIYALSQGIFPAEEPRVEWPTLQRSLTANLEIHDIPVNVEFPPGPLEELCWDCFRSCPPTTKPARCHISARRMGDGWRVYANDCEILASLADEQLGLGFLHAARFLLYAESGYDVAFHAATVANDLCGVMISAPREAGKSTLAAYLMSRGFGLHTDEPTLLDLDTGCVSSLSLPISLKERSWTVLQNEWPQLAQAPAHVRSDGIGIRLLHPPPAGASTSSPRLSQIVFPEYRSSGMVCVERLTHLQTLSLLNQAGMILARHLPRYKFEAFLRMICTTPAHTLRYGSLPEAFSIIARLADEA